MAELLPIEVRLATAGHYPDRPTVTGEITDVPQLAITPAVMPGNSYTGGWTLTHIPTGRSLNQPWAGDEPELLRDTATYLAAEGLDWSQVPDKSDSDGQKPYIHAYDQARKKAIASPLSIDYEDD